MKVFFLPSVPSLVENAFTPKNRLCSPFCPVSFIMRFRVLTKRINAFKSKKNASAFNLFDVNARLISFTKEWFDFWITQEFFT